MTKQEFAKLAKSKILVLDGATGSNLQKAGMPRGVCPELWVMDHPDVLKDLQRAYADAGSDIVYAPTFGANRPALREHGLEDKLEYMNNRLVRLSKEAVAGRALVAGDITMTGQQLEPLGPLKIEELIGIYKEQIKAMLPAEPDLLVIETMISLQEARCALIAAKEMCSLPVMVTMSFDPSGRTMYGTDAMTAATVLEGLGADAVGVNCSAGPDRLGDIVRTFVRYTNLPVIAKPNAGLPHTDENGNAVYDMDAPDFAGYMELLISAGAGIVGGCCGTEPSYIRMLKDVAKGEAPRQVGKAPVCISNERSAIPAGTDLHIGIIAAVQNETLAEELANGETDELLDLLDEQEDEEADVIVLSVEAPGVDALEAMKLAVDTCVGNSRIPLAFATNDEGLMEVALRRYPGRAGIITDEVTDPVVRQVALRYGAVLIDR